MNKRKRKVITKKFKGGGYFRSEEVEPGITIIEMDGKGFVKEFVESNPLILDDDIPDKSTEWVSDKAH